MKKWIKRIIKVVLIILIILIVVLFTLILLRNKIGTYVIENNGSKNLNRQLEVQNLYISPSKLNISWDNFTIADDKDPWKNSIETGKCKFEFEFWPLTAKKLVINKIEVDNLQFGSKRNTATKSENLNKTNSDKNTLDDIKNKIQNEKENMPIFNKEILRENFSLKNIEKSLDLNSPNRFRQAKADLEIKLEFWNEKLNSQAYESRLKNLNSKFNTLQKNKKTTLELSGKYIQLFESYQTLIQDIKKDKKILKTDIENIKNLRSSLKASLENDYKKIENSYASPEAAIQNIGLLLLGDKFSEYSLLLMESLEDIRNLGSENTRNKEKRIDPNNKYARYPDLWIKDASILTNIGPYKLSGRILDVSSDQKLTGLPIKFNLNSIKKDSANISLVGDFDYTGQSFVENVNLSASNVTLKELPLNRLDFLPIKILDSNLNLQAKLSGVNQNIDLLSNIKLANISFKMKDSKNYNPIFYDIAKSIAEKTDFIDFDFVIKNKPNDFDLNIDSNLNSLLKTEMKMHLNKKIDVKKSKLKTGLQKRVDPIEDDIQNTLDSELKPILNKLNMLELSTIRTLKKNKDIHSSLNKKIDKNLDKLLEKIK